MTQNKTAIVVPVGIDSHEGQNVFLLWCPGCQEAHQFSVPPWTFNGNLDKPTIGGSILVQGVRHGVKYRCHSFVVDGQWQYLTDCTHAMAGKTVGGIPFSEGIEGIKKDDEDEGREES